MRGGRNGISTSELARELGVKPRELRRWLRWRYPRPPEERGTPWQLAEAQVKAARRHFRPARRRRRLALASLLILVLLTIGAGGIAGAAYWQAEAYVEELQAGPKRAVVAAVRPELDVPPRRPAVPTEPGPARTILLIGSDGRWHQPKNRRSDTMLLVRLDPSERRIALLSVPRDLLVEIPGRGMDRVNEAYKHGGAALLARTLRESLGVEINHFVAVDFRGFRRLVGALGGVYLPVDGRYFNENRGTPGTNYAEIDLRPGYQLLDGEQALAFARYRHLDSDFLRAARQQLLVREAARQVLAERYDVLRLRELIGIFADATTSDIDDLGTLWRLFRAVEETPASRIARFTVPAREAVVRGAFYLRGERGAIRRTVRAWYGRQVAAPTPARRPPAATPRRPRPGPALVPDSGRGRVLAAALGPVTACAPTALPRGFWWPEGGSTHRYELSGRAAAALAATRGSGRSVLWTMTTWKRPPALADPSATLERRGRTYELWYENRRLRQVAWRMGDVRVWITNTLRNELSIETMLRLADTCRRR